MFVTYIVGMCMYLDLDQGHLHIKISGDNVISFKKSFSLHFINAWY